MRVRDIALKEVYCANASMDLSEVASMMKRHNIGVVPVCEGKKIVGLVTDRDLVISCMAADMDPKDCIAREFMTANPVTVTPDSDLEDAARIMGREQLHRLPVVEDGTLVGMISLGDVSIALGNDSFVAETLRKISTTNQPVTT